MRPAAAGGVLRVSEREAGPGVDRRFIYLDPACLHVMGRRGNTPSHRCQAWQLARWSQGPMRSLVCSRGRGDGGSVKHE